MEHKLGINWFMNEFNAVNTLADCSIMGVEKVRASLSILNYYINYLFYPEKILLPGKSCCRPPH